MINYNFVTFNNIGYMPVVIISNPGPSSQSPALDQNVRIREIYARELDFTDQSLSQQREHFEKYPEQFQQEIDDKCKLLQDKCKLLQGNSFQFSATYKSSLCKNPVVSCHGGETCDSAHTYSALIASNLVLSRNLQYKTMLCPTGDKNCAYSKSMTCHKVHKGDPMQFIDPVDGTVRWGFYDPSRFVETFDPKGVPLPKQREFFFQNPEKFQQEIDRKCQLLRKTPLRVEPKYKTALCKHITDCKRDDCIFAHNYTALIASNLILGANPRYKTMICRANANCRYIENFTCHKVHSNDPIQVFDPVYNTSYWTFYNPDDKTEQEAQTTVLGVARALLGEEDVPPSEHESR